MSVVVITGAAGLVGSMLRPRLARPGRTLRVLDIAPLTAGPGEEAIAASVTDMDAMTAACQGADALIHLAGIPGEASWERISELNINGSYVAFEAARRASTSRVIFASSNHAVGFTPRADFPVPDYAFPKPDTYYGVSKAAVEALRGPQDSVQVMLAEYRRRRDFVVERLRSIPGVRCAEPKGAFYAYPNIGVALGKNGIAPNRKFACHA